MQIGCEAVGYRIVSLQPAQESAFPKCAPTVCEQTEIDTPQSSTGWRTRLVMRHAGLRIDSRYSVDALKVLRCDPECAVDPLAYAPYDRTWQGIFVVGIVPKVAKICRHGIKAIYATVQGPDPNDARLVHKH